jgi:aerobic carbon-monoxide dehydrogenase medium subunit
MIPAPFGYARASSASHAAGLLAGHGDDAKLLAGGQSLLPMMTLRLSRPAMLIDVGMAGLSGIAAGDGELVIGAATTHAEIASSSLVRAQAPAAGVCRRPHR